MSGREPQIVRKTLGRTGLNVTQLGFGAAFRPGPDGHGSVSDETAEKTLNAVLDEGINFIDTAPDYGLSEERIGRYVSSRRNEYFLASKAGCDPVDKGGQGDHIWTREQLLKNIEGSLKRLKTDHVDLLQLHNPRGEDVHVEELIGTLREIKSQGMTRFIGASHTLPLLDEYVATGAFDTFQIPYSCLEPQHHDAISRAAKAGAGIIVRGGIGYGGPEADVLGNVRVDLWEQAGLQELCGAMKPAEFILRYTITHPHCHTTIVGTSSIDHLRDNVAAMAKGPLPDDLYDEVRCRVAAVVGG